MLTINERFVLFIARCEKKFSDFAIDMIDNFLDNKWNDVEKLKEIFILMPAGFWRAEVRGRLYKLGVDEREISKLIKNKVERNL